MTWQTFFSQQVRALREARGLSKSELGRRIGVRHVQIIDYENGKKTPSVEHLVGLARALDTTPNDLLGWDHADLLPS